MSDDSVHTALRSSAPLVVIEAPAGCGKTHQGAEYARQIATADGPGRPLILTHTHAACSVFAERTSGTTTRVDIRTIDSIVAQVAAAYHGGLGLPADTAAWLRQRGETGYQELALMVATLLRRRPMIAAAMARRHPIIICDEHQDSSGDQHSVVMAMHGQGARLRMFADPMQKIFRTKMPSGSDPPFEWDTFSAGADAHETLDRPHRWERGCPRLGQWTLDAREALKTGNAIDLRNGLPPSVRVVFAENKAQAARDYRLDGPDRRPVDVFEKAQGSLLILTHYSDTARSLRAFFSRRISLWEGYTRPGLDKLVNTLATATGDAPALAAAVISFMDDVGKGFSPSAFGDAFVDEVRQGCTKRRKGKPALIQELARPLVDDPSHRGVARMLDRLLELKASEASFKNIEMDCYREFRDAIRLGAFEAPEAGLAELTNRRTYSRPKPPSKAISTIHKAKGLECESVIVMPCDRQTFPDKPDARCLLYVALSRASSHLMLVVSRDSPSPLLTI